MVVLTAIFLDVFAVPVGYNLPRLVYGACRKREIILCFNNSLGFNDIGHQLTWGKGNGQ